MGLLYFSTDLINWPEPLRHADKNVAGRMQLKSPELQLRKRIPAGRRRRLQTGQRRKTDKLVGRQVYERFDFAGTKPDHL